MSNKYNSSNKYREILAKRLPSGWQLSTTKQDRTGGASWAIEAPDGSNRTLRIVVSPTSEIREIQALLAEAIEYSGDPPDLVVAPFLGPKIRSELAAGGMGYLDLTSNCSLSVAKPGLVIEIQGADRNPNPIRRPVRSMSGPKVGRVLRTLCMGKRAWGVRELATETTLNPGYVSRLLDFLYREALIDRGRRNRVEYVDWQAIIRHWSLDAPLENRGPRLSCIAPRGLPALLEKLGASGLRHAVSASLAAVRRVEVAPARTALVYIEDADFACDRLDCRTTTLGSNLILIEPKDDALLDCVEIDERSIRWACLPQVAVDLMSSPGRGPTEAEALIEWMKVNEHEWRR